MRRRAPWSDWWQPLKRWLERSGGTRMWAQVYRPCSSWLWWYSSAPSSHIYNATVASLHWHPAHTTIVARHRHPVHTTIAARHWHPAHTTIAARHWHPAHTTIAARHWHPAHTTIAARHWHPRILLDSHELSTVAHSVCVANLTAIISYSGLVDLCC